MAPALPETNRQYVRHIRAWSAKTTGFLVHSWPGRLRRFLLASARLLLLPMLFGIGLSMLGWLRFRHRKLRQPPPGTTHGDAPRLVSEFVAQYPLHLYCVVFKALETAFLQRELSRRLRPEAKVLEIAIGEGTLSAKLFPPSSDVTGLDLNPYSLTKASRYPHVRRAIVCDGLNPPFIPASFDLLIANNILHHVTDKEATLRNWSRLAPVLVFNDNTPSWARGWTLAYIPHLLGLRALSTRIALKIETMSIQCLLKDRDLTRTIVVDHEVLAKESYYSERTHFLCGIFSFFLLSFGPPTPPLVKSILLGPLRRFSLWLTTALANELVLFDAGEPRADDVGLSYVCQSRNVGQQARATDDLICPHDGMPLAAQLNCPTCGRSFRKNHGLLFVLPDDLRAIEDEFDAEVAAAVPAEHL